MRMTEPGDVLSYCQKWIAFQEYYSEVLPAIPVYSNVYFDFYTPNLQEYYVGSSASWAQLIMPSPESVNVPSRSNKIALPIESPFFFFSKKISHFRKILKQNSDPSTEYRDTV